MVGENMEGMGEKLKLIDRIKGQIEYAGQVDMDYCPEVTHKDVAALIEYYEAAEGEFRYSAGSGDTPMYRRLKKARAALEKEE